VFHSFGIARREETTLVTRGQGRHGLFFARSCQRDRRFRSFGLLKMVTKPTIMTMSKRAHTWSIASAKAGLSRVVDDAQRRPQVIERRGKPVAMVVAIEQFQDGTAATRWKKFLEASAAIRVSGGGELRVPRRERRASPFGRV
jgi:antitoxin (DNA-binding transcriptional repressor) of toxin-antitoxin stability system